MLSFISWSNIQFSTILILPFLLTKILIVSWYGYAILNINHSLIHQHRELVNLLIPNTLLDLKMLSTFELDTLRPFRFSIIIVWKKFTSSSNSATYSKTIIFPCFSSRNSISFLLHTSSGKYFSKNSAMNTTQVISAPTVSSLWRTLSHQSSTSYDSIWVPNCTFWAYVQAITQKLFSISLSHVCAPYGSYLPLKVGRLFHWNFHNPHNSSIAWFYWPCSAWAITSKASTVVRSFLPPTRFLHTSKQPLEETFHG